MKAENQKRCYTIIIVTLAIHIVFFLIYTIGIGSTRIIDSKKASPFVCSTSGKYWIVVTSIQYPTLAIYKFLNLTTRWNLVVIGDRLRVLFLTIEDQLSLGYLVAIACGAPVIFESDDDNILKTNDIQILPKIAKPDQIPWIAFRQQRSPFVNIYGSFGYHKIWPRGFPVNESKKCHRRRMAFAKTK